MAISIHAVNWISSHFVVSNALLGEHIGIDGKASQITWN
jgi:hypothetical protein